MQFLNTPLSQEQINALKNVRQLGYSDGITVGSVVCRNGAWDRKYVVESITLAAKGKHGNEYAVALRNLGKFFADGRVELAKKPVSIERRAASTIFEGEERPVPSPYGFIGVVPHPLGGKEPE